MPFVPERDSFNMVLIDHHFDQIKFNKPRWTNDRVYRLCQMMGITVWELACMCRIPFETMLRFMNANQYPPYVVLHFVVHELTTISVRLGGKKVDILPPGLMLGKGKDGKAA